LYDFSSLDSFSSGKSVNFILIKNKIKSPIIIYPIGSYNNYATPSINPKLATVSKDASNSSYKIDLALSLFFFSYYLILSSSNTLSFQSDFI